MQTPFEISKKLEYGLRAMAFLASLPQGHAVPFREIAMRMKVPKDFLAKILKTLSKQGLVASTRGTNGGYSLKKNAHHITFLDVVEAIEGPVGVNVCTDRTHDGCRYSGACTLFSVFRQGQDRMIEVFRGTTLDKLAMRGLSNMSPFRREE